MKIQSDLISHPPIYSIKQRGECDESDGRLCLSQYHFRQSNSHWTRQISLQFHSSVTVQCDDEWWRNSANPPLPLLNIGIRIKQDDCKYFWINVMTAINMLPTSSKCCNYPTDRRSLVILRAWLYVIHRCDQLGESWNGLSLLEHRIIHGTLKSNHLSLCLNAFPSISCCIWSSSLHSNSQ